MHPATKIFPRVYGYFPSCIESCVEVVNLKKKTRYTIMGDTCTCKSYEVSNYCTHQKAFTYGVFTKDLWTRDIVDDYKDTFEELGWVVKNKDLPATFNTLVLEGYSEYKMMVVIDKYNGFNLGMIVLNPNFED